MRRRSPKKRSFTLIEVLLVVIILGILAGIAIPRFIRTAEKARGEEAITNLRLIFAGERMYRLDNGIYTQNWETDGGGGLSPEYIEKVKGTAKEKYFTFLLNRDSDANLQTFTATATRKGTGIYGGDTITIDQDEVWDGSWPSEWLPED